MSRFSQPVPTRKRLWAILSLVAFIAVAVIRWIPVGKGEWSLRGVWLSLPDRDGAPDPFVLMQVLLPWTVCVGVFAGVVGWLGQAVVGAVVAILARQPSEPPAQANRSTG